MDVLLENFEEFWDNRCKDVLEENREIDFLIYLYYHMGELVYEE